MGRHKFRLSDMIPNVWFFKLRDMRAARGPASPGGPSRAGRLPSTPRQHGASSSLPHRASYYYSPRAGDPAVESPLHTKAADTPFPPLPLTPPRRSCSKRRHRRRSVRLAPSASGSSGVSSPADAGCRCRRRPAVEQPDTPPCRRDNFVGYDNDDDDGEKPTVTVPADYDLGGKVITSATDIIIDLRTRKRPDKVLLPPIITKPSRRETADGYEPEDKHMDGTQRTAAVSQPSKAKPRRSVSSSSARRLKTRANTPRVASPKKPKPPPARTAKAPPLAESFAVVKTSRDPRRDFRESMEEMIAENAICDAADLEDLLACYLSLNAAEYHDLIVDVFERIWAGRAGVDM